MVLQSPVRILRVTRYQRRGGERQWQLQRLDFKLGRLVSSAPATLVVDAPAPPTFTLSSSCATAVVVGLQWEVSDPTVTQYQILRNGVPLTTTPNLYFADTNVAATTSYSYVVRAQNSSGATLHRTL